MPEFSPVLNAAIEAAQEAATMISKRAWSTNISQKEHPTFGTSSTSETDKEAEKLIVGMLASRLQLPDVLYVAEESAKAIEPEKVFETESVFFIDPRDGTTEDSHECSFWCVSIGSMNDGNLDSGVVVNPDIRGGVTIAAEDRGGVYVSERGLPFRPADEVVHVPPTANPLIHLGLDVQRLDVFHRFIRALPRKLKPRGVSASGAFGLAYVAIGRIDAIVQSPQMPWDFAGSMSILLERTTSSDKDLAVMPYRIEHEKVKPCRLYDQENFRTDRQMMGFVAGKAGLVEPLFELLVKNYGE